MYVCAALGARENIPDCTIGVKNFFENFELRENQQPARFFSNPKVAKNRDAGKLERISKEAEGRQHV